MASVERPSASLAQQTKVDIEPDHVVFWLRGEHGIDTVAELADVIAHAIAFSDADLVLDLSEVPLMGSATVRLLIRARDLLEVRARSLVLRSPVPGARRLLHVGGLAELIDASAAVPVEDGPATAVPIDIDSLLDTVARTVHGRVPALSPSLS